MFVLKKIISVLIYPLTICLILLSLGMVLSWLPRRQKLGRIIGTVGLALLFLCTFRPFADMVTESLEQQYPHIKTIDQIEHPETVKWVVVLGAGAPADERLPPNLQISTIALSRLVEGIRLHRLLPGTKLILSGGATRGPVSHAERLKRAALQLGVKAEDVVLETLSLDTADEAAFIRNIVGQDRFLLVTSALHLPRSVGLFRKQGMTPIPAPGDQWSKPGRGMGLFDFAPGAFQLHELERSYHEYVGILWAKLRGQI